MTIGSRVATRCVRSALRSNVMTIARFYTPTTIRITQRSIASTAVRLHGHGDGHDHDHDHDYVPIGQKRPSVPVVQASAASDAHHHHGKIDHDHDHDHAHAHDHDSDDDSDDEDDQDMVDTVAVGPSGIEYGGPQRGGQFKEPTRFGDWERKGRCTDF